MRRLEFCPEVLGGDVILPRAGRAGTGVKPAAAAAFHQRRPRRRRDRMGGAAPDASTATGRPLGAAHAGGRGRHAALHPGASAASSDERIEPFTGFALDASARSPSSSCSTSPSAPATAPLALRPGRYCFELFVKASNARAPKLERPSSTCWSRSTSTTTRRRPRGLPHRLPDDACRACGASWPARNGCRAATPARASPDTQAARRATGSGPWRPSPWRRGTSRAAPAPRAARAARSGSRRRRCRPAAAAAAAAGASSSIIRLSWPRVIAR